jgi:hypothetical protein
VHRAHRTTVITIRQLTGAFVASWPATAPTHRYSCNSGCPGQRLGAATFLLLLLLLPPPWAWAPALGLLSPFATWVAGECQAWPSIALVYQAEERRNILDVVGGELLQHLLIPYSLAKCNHYRSIGDTRNGITNLREPLDEGAQGFPQALLDGLEIGLVTRPSISALEVGRELVAKL